MASVTSPRPHQRFICIHGHFYQPPRENPWLEAVETQDSAAPYHDWNERITAECYAANGAARIVDGANRIVRIVNNYSHMSFNFGPTLLSWMEEHAPITYKMILHADRLSQNRFSGHGSAMAQVYNHIIMPLASRRDRETQIVWGIADFEHRFGRKPEGMWLAETAVDVSTLDLMARHGIRFTVLAPHQCARVRPLPADEDAHGTGVGAGAGERWFETPEASVDSTRPYTVKLSEGRSIAVFFYNGPLSRAIAFERLLNSGDDFARRLTGGFRDGHAGPQLVHVATDGESYGHHHRHGEMALAYAMHTIEERGDARLTNYGEYLALFPPTAEAQIQENTAWSCFHGVERWRSDCGCGNSAIAPSQKWRAPLRDALDWLRDLIAKHMADEAELFTDPDAARNDYISIILDRSRGNIDAFFARHTTRALSAPERTRALEMMEMERHALLMYTSCGWFFEDISGIETVQIIAYAARALELAASVFGLSRAVLESRFVDKLTAAQSSRPDAQDGGALYRECVGPMAVTLEQVAAHYAISAVFTEGSRASAGGREPLFCYTVERTRERSWAYGAGRLVLARLCVRSRLTEESAAIASAVLHFGDQNITAAVKPFSAEGEAEISELEKECGSAVAAGTLLEIVHAIDRVFGSVRYSLTSLFRDEQRRILQNILRPTVEEAEASLSAVYARHASLLNYLSRTELPKPAWLRVAAQLSVHTQIRRAMLQEHIDAERILDLLDNARADMVVLEEESLELLANMRMREAMLALERSPGSLPVLEKAVSLAHSLERLPFAPNLWEAQNLWFGIQGSIATERRGRNQAGPEWREEFNTLGHLLSINIEQMAASEDEQAGTSGVADLQTSLAAS